MEQVVADITGQEDLVGTLLGCFCCGWPLRRWAAPSKQPIKPGIW